MSCPDLLFTRWAKTAAIKSGRLNMWQPHKIFDADEYAYNRETRQFFKSDYDSNSTILPHYEGNKGWRLVEEDKFNDGLIESEIVISVSKGDVVLRPLYFYCTGRGQNDHMSLENTPFTHGLLESWHHNGVTEKAHYEI